MPPVEFLTGARRDFDESFDWYAARSTQAAVRISEAVDAALIDVLADPVRFATTDGIHRECRVKRFPFRIVYRLAEDRFVVVAIAHVKRRPGFWRNRN